ncbi:MAG: glycosyltransferase [Verrucomicrobiia bacterium]
MSLLHRLRRRLAELILRGRMLDLWVQRKIRRLERHYQRELAARSQAKLVRAAPHPPLRRNPRRILLISDFQWEGKELVPELEKICPVDALNLHPSLTASENRRVAPREVVVAELRNWVANHGASDPDVILFYARPALLSNEAFHVIRTAFSCPVLGMNLDDKIQYLDYGTFSERNDNYEQWAPSFDLNLTNVRAVTDWYEASGSAVYYMPEGYHAKTEPPEGQPAYRHEMAFVGSWRAERAELHRRMRRLGVPLEVFGWGWPNAQEGSAPESIYRSSMLTLGIGFASPSTVLTTLKTRDFECPGAGACYLTTYNWELALHYELGKEILCYRSVEEIVELWAFYRRRPEECWKIAQAAYRRCLNEHTWEKRFRKLFEETGVAR